jgi:hypothetical protein
MKGCNVQTSAFEIFIHRCTTGLALPERYNV